jgi:branched-chain amino acid transport system substrate-binding protein
VSRATVPTHHIVIAALRARAGDTAAGHTRLAELDSPVDGVNWQEATVLANPGQVDSAFAVLSAGRTPKYQSTQHHRDRRDLRAAMVESALRGVPRPLELVRRPLLKGGTALIDRGGDGGEETLWSKPPGGGRTHGSHAKRTDTRRGRSTLKERTSRLFAQFCILLALPACAGEQGDESILIGEFAALTGTTATFGLATHEGIQFAVDEVNAAGGLLGRQVRLIVEDTQGRPEEAQVVVTKLIASDGVIAVLGEAASSRTLAAAPVAQQANIPLITPSSTNERVTEVGDYIFRVCFIDPFQGLVMAKFAYNSLGVRRAAVLRDVRNDYSVGLADVFVENFRALGGTIVGDVSYSEGDTDFSAQITSLRASSPEAIFIPGYYTEVGLIARQVRQLGMTVPLLGGDGWDSPRLTEIGGQAMNDSYFSTHYSPDDPDPQIQRFVTRYTERSGRPPDALVALGYDAASLLFDAIRRAGTTEPAAVRDALANTRDFAGVSGTISIDERRDAVKPAVILRVVDGRYEYVETIEP